MHMPGSGLPSTSVPLSHRASRARTKAKVTSWKSPCMYPPVRGQRASSAISLPSLSTKAHSLVPRSSCSVTLPALRDDALVEGDPHVARVMASGFQPFCRNCTPTRGRSYFVVRVARELLARLRHQGRHDRRSPLRGDHAQKKMKPKRMERVAPKQLRYGWNRYDGTYGNWSTHLRSFMSGHNRLCSSTFTPSTWSERASSPAARGAFSDAPALSLSRRASIIMPAAASRALRRLAAKKWEGENPLTSSVHNRDRVSCPTGMDNNGLGGTPRHQAATITWLSFGRADADIIVTHIRRTRLEHEGAGQGRRRGQR